MARVQMQSATLKFRLQPPSRRRWFHRIFGEPRKSLQLLEAAHGCPLCSHRDAYLLASCARDGAPLRTVLCRGCGLARVDPLPDAESVSQYYRQGYRQEYKGVVEPKLHHVLRSGRIAVRRMRMLRRWIQPGQTLLDVGCGGGELVFVLSRQGIVACGHEEDSCYAEYARREFGIVVSDGTWQTFEECQNRFDMITLFHVLEHLPQPVEALARLRSCLAPDGRVVVEVPNLEFAFTLSLNRFHRAHLYHFNPFTLSAVGERAGFRALEVFTSEDGGNVTAVFAAGPRPEGVERDLGANVARVLSQERRRSAARYFLSPMVWKRTLVRLARMAEERIRVQRYSSPRAILESLLAGEAGSEFRGV